jgi:hypothetical protein
MNTGLLTQLAEVVRDVAGTGEFSDVNVQTLFSNVPCALDTLLAGNRMVTRSAATQEQTVYGVVFIVDTRLGRLPNRNFKSTDFLRIDGIYYEIAEIHEAINRLTGDLDHFEVYVYEGVNR